VSRAALGPARVLALAGTLGACDRATVIVTEPDAPAAVQRPEDDPLVIHAAVREAVREYLAALDARDVERVRTRVVDATFDYYEDLRGLALTASRDQLEQLDLMNVVLVLQIRAAVSGPELEAIDGAALFERAVSEGLVGGDAAGVPLDEVWLANDERRAEIRVEDQAVVWLVLEHDSWRVDIPTMTHNLGQTLGALARERIIRDGKVFTALSLLRQTVDVDPAVVDGPLDAPVDGSDHPTQ